MSKTAKRTFIWTIIIGILGSIAIGLSTMFIFDVVPKAASYIIGMGSALTAIIGGVITANEKKSDGKK